MSLYRAEAMSTGPEEAIGFYDSAMKDDEPVKDSIEMAMIMGIQTKRYRAKASIVCWC